MNTQQTNFSERALAENKIKSARYNLLLMIILTVVNLILLAVGSDSMMLFSATVPYFSVVLGMAFELQEFLIAGYVIAAVILALYLLCWLLSKKHFAWMLIALILFAIDTICLVLLYIGMQDFSGILDLVIHVAVLYYLFTGVRYGIKMRSLPEYQPYVDNTMEDAYVYENNTPEL